MKKKKTKTKVKIELYRDFDLVWIEFRFGSINFLISTEPNHLRPYSMGARSRSFEGGACRSSFISCCVIG
ncbi:hypothetical protein EUGRSUZ_J02195 [Eucalyptus grandis]|uniref:Uncharacterized protein n=2 Tax=Eucalyptus grandis TaxID=71139 RepID=A0ACC3JA98_EUCGR|nr:hypothetical protein EUGRSUZ_J02195 [Eucalyptus grandis]